MISTTATEFEKCPFSERIAAIWQELRHQLGLLPWSRTTSVHDGREEVPADVSDCLRGLLVMLAGEVAVASREELLPAATAMELLAFAMQDVSAGGEAFRSVRVGEVMYTRGLSLVARMRSEAVQVFADLAEHLVAQKWNVRSGPLLLKRTEEEYLEHAFAKSAIVLANCCKMGALLGSCPSEVVEAMTAYGYSLGMALHIGRDLRALLEGDGERVSLARWVEGHVPLPVIHSLQESRRTRLLLSSLEMQEQSVARATLLRCLRETDSIRYTHAVVESYAKKAKASLSVLPDAVMKKLLVELVERVGEQGL